jgi:hypothetical protein
MKLYLKPLVTCCLSMLLAACSQTRAEPTKLSTNTMPAMSISQPETPKSILVTKTPTPITVTLASMETETLTVEKFTGTLEPTSTIKPLLPLDADAIRGEILFSIYPEGDIGLVKADGTGMKFLLQTPNNQMINVNRHAQWLPD